MKFTPVKTTGDTLTAEEYNETPSQELQNSVLSSGQPLVETDEFQLGQAMAVYGSAGDFYTDSGIANTYVLSPINLQQVPPAYTNGLRARFVATNTNTGNTTVNLNGLGAKSIKEGGAELVSGRIVAGEIIEISFLTASDEFELISSGVVKAVIGGNSITVDATDPANPIVNADDATTDQKGVVEKSTSAENIAGVAVDKYPDVVGVKEMIDTHAAAGNPFDQDLNTTDDPTFGEITATIGINLGGVAAANLLDDYEEGSWTPSWEGLPIDPTVTYSDQRGNYVKVGRIVYIRGRLLISTIAGGSGQAEIAGLPFVSESSITQAIGTSNKFGFVVNGPDLLGVSQVSTKISVRYDLNTTVGFIMISDLQAGTDLHFSGSYETSA